MIFLKDKYRIILDKRNVAAVIALIATTLTFLFFGRSILYQTPILIIMTSVIVIDMLPNKVNPFHVDNLVMAKVNEEQVKKVFTIFKNTFNLILGEILYWPHEMRLEIKDISIGQLKDATLLINSKVVLDTGIKIVLIHIKMYRLSESCPLISFFIPLQSDISKSMEEMRITKNLDRWKDIIVLAKTVEYFLLSHQYDGAIKNEERRI